MDDAVKLAFQSYIDNIEESITTKPEHGFYKLSKDPVAIYGEKKPEHKIIPQRIIHMIAAWSKQISNLDHIDKSVVEIRTMLETRRFIDSQGRKIKDYSYLGYIQLTVDVKHKDNFKIEYKDSISLKRNTQLIKSAIQPTLDDIIHYSEQLQSASMPESNQYPVIFGGSAGCTFFHEFVGGHLLSGKYIAKGEATVFKNKLNQKILPEFLTLIDNPQKPNAFGYYKYDEEGIEGKRLVLVENGRLMNYLLDRHYAPYFGMKSNGHARAEWVTTAKNNKEIPLVPEPRASNLEVISTNSVPDDELLDIMKKYCVDHHIPYGIYIESKQGEVEFRTSEVQMTPLKAWKIFPDGKKEVITSFIIVGKPYELLNQIALTGKTLETSCSDCEDDSGDLPTQETSPAIFIPQVTVQQVPPKKYAEFLAGKPLKD